MAQIKHGTTDVTRYVVLLLTADGSPATGLTITDLDLQYTRTRGTPATKVDATALGATNSAHGDNQAIEIDATSSPGLYRVDWPDAAFATGADTVQLVVTGPTIRPAVEEIELVANVVDDVIDSNGFVSLNMEQALDTTPTADTLGDALFNAARSLPNGVAPAASGGLPTVDGSNYIAGIQGTVNTFDELLSASSTLLVNTTATASSTTTQIFLTAVPGTDADDDYNNLLLIIRDASDSNRPSLHVITNYTAASNVCDISPNCRFTPANGDPVQVWAVADSNVMSELLKLSTGFSTSSPDNLNSYLKAMMSKAASTPASVGTFSAATDSVEAIRELLDLMAGAGFSTGTDSLAALRDAFDTLITPSVVSSTSLSGSGLISDLIGCVRRAVDEPSTNPKYTNADILEFIHGAFDVVLADLNVNTDHPVLVRMDIAVEPTKQTYNLPPTVAEVHRVGKVNSTTGLLEWEIWPGNEFSGHGRGFTIEGNTLRLQAKWQTTETISILYVPNSEVSIHKGTIASGDVATDVTSTTLKFAASPDDGNLDTRQNCYAGYLLRLLTSSTGIVQERSIVSSTITGGRIIVTIDEAWTSTPAAGTAVTYEVVPMYGRLIRHVVCLRAAMDILAQEGNEKRISTLMSSYQVKVSALRRRMQSKNARFPHSLTGDTLDNENRGLGWFGIWQ